MKMVNFVQQLEHYKQQYNQMILKHN
jgi:hypothetical protein